MALHAEDRSTLAKMTNLLAPRVANKLAAKKLRSVTQKLIYATPLSSSEKELLVIAVRGFLASPYPPLPISIGFRDYLLVTPAIQKFTKLRRLRRQARATRKNFKGILSRLEA